jgi:hypothetical protein
MQAGVRETSLQAPRVPPITFSTLQCYPPAHVGPDDVVDPHANGCLSPEDEEPVLQLVADYFEAEPKFRGAIARVDQAGVLGRGEPASVGGPGSEPGDPPLLSFFQVRPGDAKPMGALTWSKLSRRQLVFEPGKDEYTVRVRCVGKRPLLHCGKVVTECVARPGDTLMLEQAAVFHLEMRPPKLPVPEHYPPISFPFGMPDPPNTEIEQIRPVGLSMSATYDR